VVRHDVVAIGECFTADSTFHVLLDDLTSQQYLYLCGRPDFPKSPGMVGIVNAPNADEILESLRNLLPSAAEKRLVNRTVFLFAEFH
jgi:hypothetical protein